MREYDGKMENQLDRCSRELLPLKRECEDCRIVGSIEPFVQAVERLYETMEKYLEEHGGEVSGNSVSDNDVSEYGDEIEQLQK